jgi:hypothetical protein
MNPMQMMGLLQQSNNPMALLQQLASNNPLMGRAMQMGQGRSVDELKVIAQNLARQRGMSDTQYRNFISSFNL